MNRPEMGELTIGQWVMVRCSANDMRWRKPEDYYIPAEVVKVARVWVDLKAVDNTRTWHMRKDTQSEATQYSGSNDRFLTLDQHAWEVRRKWALGVLADHGIQLDHRGSRWAGREAELAELLIKGDAES